MNFNPKEFTLLQALPQMTWINLPNGKVDFYNEKWFDYTGLSFEQLDENGFAGVLHPDDVANTKHRFDEALATGKIFEIQNRYKRADGQYRWHLNRALPIKNENGIISSWIGTATDIEDKMQAESDLIHSNAKLEASEQRFSNLITQAVFPVAVYRGPHLIAEIANEPYLELVGKTRESFLGKPLFESLPEIESSVGPYIREVMATGVPFEANEYGIVMNKFGEDVFGYYNFLYQAVRDHNGTIDGFMASAVDVTEQVLARKIIEESEAHLQLLKDTVPAMIFYLDKEQRYQSYNVVFMEWFGVNHHEALGKTVAEFIGGQAYSKVQTYLARAYQGEQVRYEMYAPQKMASGKWLDIVYTPHKNPEGEVVGIIVHATDITQSKLTEISLRKSESLFRSLVEEAPVATCFFTGHDMKITFANDMMLDVWDKDRSVIGLPLENAVPELKGQPFLAILEEVFTTGKTFEGKAVPADLIVNGVKRTYYFDFSYKAIKDGDGHIYGVMDMAVDVTAQVENRKQIEAAVEARTRELAESNANLQRSNAELEQFAFIASHDLQEPIRKIVPFSNCSKTASGL